MKQEPQAKPITYTADELKKAVKIVQAAIQAKEDKCMKMVSINEDERMLIEGKTDTGFECQLMIEANEAATILMNYDYPVWRVLGMDAPREMWEKLAELCGLEDVYSVDF